MSRKAKERDRARGAGIGYNSPTRPCSNARSPTFPPWPAAIAAASYQRLEFLGDHVLGLAVSDMLFRAFPRANEGELSRRLADLVRKETCADVARELDLGPALKLGTSEVNAGGRLRTAILARCLRGADRRDLSRRRLCRGGELVERFWEERMLKPLRPLRDAKTMLQEWAQARGLPTPAYREVARTGPHHDPEFRVAVELPDGRRPKASAAPSAPPSRLPPPPC